MQSFVVFAYPKDVRHVLSSGYACDRVRGAVSSSYRYSDPAFLQSTYRVRTVFAWSPFSFGVTGRVLAYARPRYHSYARYRYVHDTRVSYASVLSGVLHATYANAPRTLYALESSFASSASVRAALSGTYAASVATRGVLDTSYSPEAATVRAHTDVQYTATTLQVLQALSLGYSSATPLRAYGTTSYANAAVVSGRLDSLYNSYIPVRQSLDSGYASRVAYRVRAAWSGRYATYTVNPAFVSNGVAVVVMSPSNYTGPTLPQR